MAIETLVTVDTGGFRLFARNVENAVQRSLADAAKVGVNAAQAKAPVRTGELRGSIHATTVRRTGRGASVSIEGSAGYTIEQERGTHGRRRHRKSRGGNVHAGASGIRPHRFLAKGLLEAKRSWAGFMRAAMR
jgi:hypothetical protein